MFEKGCFYRHRNCKDMDIFVVVVKYPDPDAPKLKVLYVSQTNRNHLFWPAAETVTIHREQFGNWAPVPYTSSSKE